MGRRCGNLTTTSAVVVGEGVQCSPTWDKVGSLVGWSNEVVSSRT